MPGAKAPNCMPLLTKISLKGNYRLSDNGLDTIISVAPSLSSLNLCECPLLTSTEIENLANKLHSILRELYIDDCVNVEPMMILPALQKIKHLEVLSMSGIQSVCDKFVNELIPIHGSNFRELAFAGCLYKTQSLMPIQFTPHPHAGDKWCIYPSYDYAHCMVDSLENITHSVISAGLRRRGVSSTVINSFIRGIGMTRSDNSLIRVDHLEYHIREELNKIASQTMAVLRPLKVLITNLEDGKVIDLEGKMWLDAPADDTSYYKRFTSCRRRRVGRLQGAGLEEARLEFPRF